MLFNRLYPSYFSIYLLTWGLTRALSGFSEAQANDTVGVPTSVAATAESDQFQSHLRAESTSDRIVQKQLTVDYANHRRDPYWPFAGERAEDWDYGVGLELNQGQNLTEQYGGAEAVAKLGRKLSHSWLVQAQAGVHELRNVTKARDQGIPVFKGSVFFTPTELMLLGVSLKNDFVYQELIQPAGVAQALQATTVNLNFFSRWHERAKHILNADYRLFSDGNSKKNLEFAEMFGVSVGSPWIWVGVGGDLFSFAHNGSGYWSPTRFYSFGPRAEFAMPIYERLSGVAGVSLSSYREESLDPGTGIYSNLKLQYGAREHWLLEITYERIRSGQQTGNWSSDAASVSLATSL